MSIEETKKKIQGIEDDKLRKYEQKKIKLFGTLNKVFATKEGKTALKHIKSQCGFGQGTVVIDPKSNEINKDSTIYNLGRLSIYEDLRRHLDPKILKDIEF